MSNDQHVEEGTSDCELSSSHDTASIDSHEHSSIKSETGRRTCEAHGRHHQLGLVVVSEFGQEGHGVAGRGSRHVQSAFRLDLRHVLCAATKARLPTTCGCAHPLD
jgi:hypothetical protein